MNITTNELIALAGILATVAGCVHRICLTVEQVWPLSKAAKVAAQVDSVVQTAEQIAGVAK